MRIGFIGDIVGRPGRKIIKENLAKNKKEYEIDFVIANGENASHGFGFNSSRMQWAFKKWNWFNNRWKS